MIIVNRKDGDVLFFTLPNGDRIEILIQKERQESVRLAISMPKSVKLSQVISGDKTDEYRLNPKH